MRPWLRSALDWMHRQPSKQADVVSILYLTAGTIMLLAGPIITLADNASVVLAVLVLPIQGMRFVKLEDARWRSMMTWVAVVIGLSFAALLTTAHTLIAAALCLVLVVNDVLTITRFTLWLDQAAKGVPSASRRLPA